MKRNMEGIKEGLRKSGGMNERKERGMSGRTAVAQQQR